MFPLVRLALLFAAVVLGGIAATLLAPLVPALAHAHAQSPVATASATVTSPHARATTAATTVWTRAVATRDLARGDTLRDGDIALVDTLVERRPPFGLDTTTPRRGWLVQRAIAAGEWLRAPAVIAPPAVTAGQPVYALWRDDHVTLAMAGVALRTAPVGATVSVRVGRTRRLDGVVIAPDTVRIR